MKAEKAWQATIGQLQMEMPKAAFDTWVRNTEFISYEDGSFIIFLLSNADKISRQARSLSRPFACTHPQCSDNFLDIKVLPYLRYLLIKNRIRSISEDVTVLPRMIKGSML